MLAPLLIVLLPVVLKVTVEVDLVNVPADTSHDPAQDILEAPEQVTTPEAPTVTFPVVVQPLAPEIPKVNVPPVTVEFPVTARV